MACGVNDGTRSKSKKLRGQRSASSSGRPVLADGADTKSLKVHFEITGTDNNVMQEVAGAIISEGTVTEEKTVSLSANGCGCLLKAKTRQEAGFPQQYHSLCGQHQQAS